MIDIPLGKALVPVEADVDSGCSWCIFNNDDYFCMRILGTRSLICSEKGRKDGKKVIFKLVDWPVMEGGSE